MGGPNESSLKYYQNLVCTRSILVETAISLINERSLNIRRDQSEFSNITRLLSPGGSWLTV